MIRNLQVFEKASDFPVPLESLFDWHRAPGAFERLAPPWERIRVLERTGGIEDGARLVMEIRKGPIPIRWTALHKNFSDYQQFCDEQVSGPFAHWEHQHVFVRQNEHESRLVDRIEFAAPFGLLGMMTLPFHRAMLKRMFAFRHQRTRNDLVRQEPYRDQPRKRIAITGASGLVGQALRYFLTTAGHEVFALVRSRDAVDEHSIFWSPAEMEIDGERLEGMDAVIHLAGSNVAQGRWTAKVKESIRNSRIQGTTLLAETLATLKKPPEVLVSASAVGYYGTSEESTFTEASPHADDFLATVCAEWESSANPARDAGIRVVHPRIGLVLSPQGGALPKMLPVFRLGIAGKLGHGRQWMSWIALDDLVGLIHHLIHNRDVEGPVNAVAPSPVRNAEFTRTLGRVLRRPTLIPAPAFAIRTALGEMGETVLLSGQRVETTSSHGYSFLHPSLEEALRFEMGIYSTK